MTTLLYTHDAFLDHDAGLGHPERADRLPAVLEVLGAARFAGLRRREPHEATPEQLKRVHQPAYVERVLSSVPKLGSVTIDADTVMSPGSGVAALRARTC